MIVTRVDRRADGWGIATSTVLMNSTRRLTHDGENGERRSIRAPWFGRGWTQRFSWNKLRLRPPRLLFLDDDPARAKTFLGKNPGAVWVKTVGECLICLAEKWDEVHLDHDLGGKTFVDMNENDCGMEVIRWMCKEPRPHLRETRFFVHTHNSVAGLLMVLQMRSSGYRAEFRPFGFDLARLLAHNEAAAAEDAKSTAHPAMLLRRWIGWLRSWKKGKQSAEENRTDPASVTSD